MALMKGNKLIKKNENSKIDDPVYPYLKNQKISVFERYSSHIHFFFKIIHRGNYLVFPFFFPFILFGIFISLFPAYTIYIYIALYFISVYVVEKLIKNEGALRYLLTDGLSWWQTGTLLSPKNPSPGLKVVATQLITSRFLVVPGPESSHNGFTRHSITMLVLFSSMTLISVGGFDHVITEGANQSLIIMVGVVWFLISLAFTFYALKNPMGSVRRFFIFDRKNQTVSFHTSFFSRKMKTLPWGEFEGRAVHEYRAGFSCKLIHAPTGNMFELQAADLHWNQYRAMEAYSYVARFMDLSQSLPDEKEFERYLPEKEDLSHLDSNEYFEYMDKKDEERQAKRKNYHNPSADTVFANIGSFDHAVKEYPWLSAKNVWAASHKYMLQPNWDKWVRDRSGLAVNEDYQVPENEREGKPEWLPQFLDFLTQNSKKIKHMDDDERIQFTQEWFEETFPELHWVDPVTADRYEQEEEFV
jgi:hypothetical protein